MDIFFHRIHVKLNLRKNNLFFTYREEERNYHGKNYNLPKSEDSRQTQCPPKKRKQSEKH